jgi:hypothetical protein
MDGGAASLFAGIFAVAGNGDSDSRAPTLFILDFLS